MILNILTLFPDILQGYFQSSIMARAVEKGLIDYRLIDFRAYAQDRHRTCDDAPYGGGPGMVIKPEPLGAALEDLDAEERGEVIYLSPSGSSYSQKKAEKLSRRKALTLICGRYEGIDQRIIDQYVDQEISVGDYVLSSGEVAALAVVDSVYRLREGVIARESLEEESFVRGLLEYPHYTRPLVYQGQQVPGILLSGNHAAIEDWRREKSLEKTRRVRPDLLETEPSGSIDMCEKPKQEDDRNGS